MKLNQNSLTANLYKWFYVTDQLPTNLCPYFWKLAFMLVVLIPYSMLCLPYLILTIFLGEIDNVDKWYDRIQYGVLAYIMLFLLWVLLSPVLLFFNKSYAKDGFLEYCMAFGIIFWLCGIVFGIIKGIQFIVELRKEKRRKKIYPDKNIYKIPTTKEPNILIEFIKAKYNKYCPKIDWY